MENVLFFFADFPVYSYGFMLGVGLILGCVIAQREGKRKGFGADFLFRFTVQTVSVFIAAGRIAFVYSLYGWRTFLYPWSLFSGAQLDESKGMVAAGLYVLYFFLRYVDRPAEFLDIIAPAAALMQSLAALGSSVLGRETRYFWGIDLGEFSLHPLPLYSALLYYFIFTLLWRTRRNLRYNGQLFLGYLALSAGAQRILLSYHEVFGESPNPWLYTLAFLLFAAAWFYIYIHSPLTAARRRPGLLRYKLAYVISLFGICLAMVTFFYWRFH